MHAFSKAGWHSKSKHSGSKRGWNLTSWLARLTHSTSSCMLCRRYCFSCAPLDFRIYQVVDIWVLSHTRSRVASGSEPSPESVNLALVQNQRFWFEILQSCTARRSKACWRLMPELLCGLQLWSISSLGNSGRWAIHIGEKPLESSVLVKVLTCILL